MADADLLLRWANDPETRANSFSKARIAYDEHIAWLERRLGSDRTRIWIFSDEDVPVGQVRFDIAEGIAEVSITVAPEQRGRGYGKAMLSEALRLLRGRYGHAVRPRAAVLAHNHTSRRLFTSCGFKETDGYCRNGDGEVVVFEYAVAATGAGS